MSTFEFQFSPATSNSLSSARDLFLKPFETSEKVPDNWFEFLGGWNDSRLSNGDEDTEPDESSEIFGFGKDF